MAACGVYTATGVSNSDLGLVVALAKADHPISIKTTKEADNSWTVVATYPPCPDGAPYEKTVAMHDLAAHASLPKIAKKIG